MGDRDTQRQTTIYDVARTAGVSPATVSRVFSGRNSVAAPTRDRVVAVAVEMGYRPNVLARSLSRQTSDMVAVLLPDLTNPFFAELVKGVQAAALEQGIITLICNTEGDPALERIHLDGLASRQVRHVIVIGLRLDRARIQVYMRQGLTFIALDRPMRNLSSVRVESDNRTGARLAVEHLVALGHRRIAHIAGPADVALSRERRRGYVDALDAARLPHDDDLVVESDFSEPGGAEAYTELVARRVEHSAVFAADDLIAMGTLSAARVAGRSVPEDLSVVGFDDALPARYAVPPLTTVRQDAVAMSRQAVDAISISDGNRSRRRLVVPVSLVVRGSTDRPSKGSAATRRRKRGETDRRH